MRATTLLCLLIPTLAAAAPKAELAGGVAQDLDGLVGWTWSCEDSLLDGRGRQGGAAACLRALIMDPGSGRSVVFAEVRVDHDEDLDPGVLQWMLRLDSGRTDRHLSAISVVSRHGHEGPTVRPALGGDFVSRSSPAMAGLKPQERHQNHATLAWEFQTWDPSIPLRFLHLKVKGSGVGAGYRWVFEEPLHHDGDWAGRPAMVWDSEWASEEPTCSFGRVRSRDFGDLVDALDGGAASLPMQARFLLHEAAAKTGVNLDFPDHKVRLELDGGKLHVLGAERFVIPLPEELLESGSIPVELVYDGRFLSVAAGDERFGPMDARRRDSGRFRWDFDVVAGKPELRHLQVTPCTAEPGKRFELPEDPPPQVARATPASTGGRAVLAVLEADGRVLARAKRARTALEVAAAALSVAQGVAAVGEASAEFAGDVQRNLDAMDRGDYGAMKSSSTRVDIGPGGVTKTRTEASLARGSDGSVGVHVTGESTSVTSPNEMLGLPTTAGHGLPEVRSAGRVATAHITGARGVSLRIGDAVLGPFTGRWVVQLRPGQHEAVAMRDGQELGALPVVAVAGGVLVLSVDERGVRLVP